MTHVTPAFDQDSFRGYEDGTESGSTAIAAANTNWTQDVETIFHARFLVQETAGGSENNKSFQLQYNRNSGGWNDVTGSSSIVQSVATSNITDGADTTQRIGAGTYISTNSGFDETDGVAGDASFAGNDEVEVLYSIKIINNDVANDDTIQLRVISGGSALDTYTNTPTITVSGQVPPLPTGRAYVIPHPNDLNKDHWQWENLIFLFKPDFDQNLQPRDWSEGGLGFPTLHGSNPTGLIASDVGLGVDFDNATGLEYVHNEKLDLVDALTLSSWVKITDIQDNGLIVGKQSVTTWTDYTDYNYAIRQDFQSNFVYEIVVGGQVSQSVSQSKSLGDIIHVVGVWDKNRNSGNLRLFIDGKEVSYASQQAKTTDISNFTLGLSVSGWTDGTNDAMRSSLIEARVYNRALSDAEIKELYAPQTRWDLFEQVHRVLEAGAAPLDGGTVTVEAAGVSSADGDLIVNASSMTDTDGDPTTTGDLIVNANADSEAIAESETAGDLIVIIDGGTVTSEASAESSADGNLEINALTATVTIAESDAAGDLIVNASANSEAIAESDASGDILTSIDGGTVTSETIVTSEAVGELIISASADSNATGESDADGNLLIDASADSEAIAGSSATGEVITIIDGGTAESIAIGVSSADGNLIISASANSETIAASDATGELIPPAGITITEASVTFEAHTPYDAQIESHTPYAVVSEDYSPYDAQIESHAPYAVVSEDYSPYEITIEKVDIMTIKGTTLARKITLTLNGSPSDPDVIYIWLTHRDDAVGTYYIYDADGTQDAEIAKDTEVSGVYYFKVLNIPKNGRYDLEGLAIWESGETFRQEFEETVDIDAPRAPMTTTPA